MTRSDCSCLWRPREAADSIYTLGFRGDMARLDAPWPTSVELPGRVTLAEISGSESFVHVETELGTLVCVERGVSSRQPEQSVVLHIDATRMFVFDRQRAAGRVRAG